MADSEHFVIPHLLEPVDVADDANEPSQNLMEFILKTKTWHRTTHYMNFSTPSTTFEHNFVQRNSNANVHRRVIVSFPRSGIASNADEVDLDARRAAIIVIETRITKRFISYGCWPSIMELNIVLTGRGHAEADSLSLIMVFYSKIENDSRAKETDHTIT